MILAIVENDINDLEKLSGFIRQFFDSDSRTKGITLEIDSYSNGYDFLECKKVYDIVFMDIDMPGMDGLSTSYKLREIDPDVPLIFVTNMAQCAIEGYKVRAFDFCLKPVTYPDVKMILNALMERIISNDDTYLTIKSSGALIKTKQSNIESIVMDGHDAILRYYMDDKIKEVRFRSSFKEILKRIDYKLLIPASSGALVNLIYVASYDSVNAVCRLKSGTSVTISRSHKKDFMISLSRY